MVPLVTAISAAAKSLAASDKVKLSAIEASFEVSPLVTVDEAMVTVGHSLGLSVLVEGVETDEQAQLVTELGCDLAQGFLYAKPMPANKVEEFLASF